MYNQPLFGLRRKEANKSYENKIKRLRRDHRNTTVSRILEQSVVKNAALLKKQMNIFNVSR